MSKKKIDNLVTSIKEAGFKIEKVDKMYGRYYISLPSTHLYVEEIKKLTPLLTDRMTVGFDRGGYYLHIDTMISVG